MFDSKMKLKESGPFCQRFGTGLKAGADLIQLLKAEAKLGSAARRDAMAHLAERAKDGELLSVSMEQKPYFPSVLVAMTRVGEETGRLERTMLMLAENYRNQLALVRSFIKSITWPCLQLFGGIVVVSLLIWLMEALNIGDLLGLGLMGVDGVLKFWGILAVFFGLLYAAWFAFTRNVGGLQNVIPLIYMIPKVGPAIQTITLARFSWTLSLALDAGLEPIRAIALSLDSTDSDYYRAGADDAKEAILAGASLEGGLRATEVFPNDFLVRVETAELSGSDAEAMENLAKEYDEVAKIAIRTLSGIASAIIWLTVVGFMVFMIARIMMSILMPYNEALDMLNNP